MDDSKCTEVIRQSMSSSSNDLLDGGSARVADSTSIIKNITPHAPKSYREEPTQKKAELLLKWISNNGSLDGILNGTTKITNITTKLKDMKYNGYLRLFDIDLTIIKTFMSENSWILLQDFKLKHKQDKWMCPQCHLFLEQDSSTWQCDRCLFWHHEKCSSPKEIRRQENLGLPFRLCLACFFVLA